MEFNWEEFEEGSPVLTGNRIHVTINPDHKMFFNRRSIEALGTPDGITLMYDRRRSVIGVKPTPLNRPSAYKLRPKDGRASGGRIISIKNFCKRFGISPDETLAFTNTQIHDGILILDLNEVRPATRK